VPSKLNIHGARLRRATAASFQPVTVYMLRFLSKISNTAKTTVVQECYFIVIAIEIDIVDGPAASSFPPVLTWRGIVGVGHGQ
jgi:hypothetical protein